MLSLVNLTFISRIIEHFICPEGSILETCIFFFKNIYINYQCETQQLRVSICMSLTTEMLTLKDVCFAFSSKI